MMYVRGKHSEKHALCFQTEHIIHDYEPGTIRFHVTPRLLSTIMNQEPPDSM